MNNKTPPFRECHLSDRFPHFAYDEGIRVLSFMADIMRFITQTAHESCTLFPSTTSYLLPFLGTSFFQCLG